MTEIRVGQPGDAEAVADVQYRAWTTSYAEIVPADAMNQVDPTAAAIHWRDSMLNPPSPSHRVLVADSGESIIGFAALGPSRDDGAAQHVGEIYILLTDPEITPDDVGVQLLTGAAEHLRGDGFTSAVSWLLAADSTAQELFARAGWQAGDERRELDMGRPVPEVRWRTRL